MSRRMRGMRRANRSGSRSVPRIEGRCIPATTGAGCPVPPCAPLRERCSLRSPVQPPRASKAAPRGRCYAPAACHVLCVRRRAPKARYARRSPAADGGLRGSGGDAPPDRCALGGAGVLDDVTAAARQRQAARGRA